MSGKAKAAMRQAVRNWRLQLKTDKALEDLARMVNPIVQGWIQYYGRFYRSALREVLSHLNHALILWARKKFKKLLRHHQRATHWLGRLARRQQGLFVHWQMGILPAVK